MKNNQNKIEIDNQKKYKNVIDLIKSKLPTYK